MGAREIEYVCEVCQRRQLAHDKSHPQGLTEKEARMIGWANSTLGPNWRPGWLCPFHAPHGKEKLESVAATGLGEQGEGGRRR